MKLTNDEAKFLISELENRQEWDVLCEMELAILFKVREAHPLVVAELELEKQRQMYEQLGKYNGELVNALQNKITWEDFQKARQAK